MAERDKCWFVRGEDRQVLVTIRQLDRDYLLVYQGMLTPVGVLPQKLQAALDKAEISPEMRVEFDRLGVMLQDSRNLFVATPEMQWYVVNDYDVPVYEIWRIDERLVVMKAQVVHALDRDEAGNLLAGTASGELHRWLEGLWRRSGAGLALTDIDKIKTVWRYPICRRYPTRGQH